MNFYVMEDAGLYRLAREEEINAAALERLGGNMMGKTYLSSPVAVRDFLRLKLGRLEHEIFSVIYLDSQNCVLGYEEMFRGTLSQTSVYPREVVKACINRNVAGVIFAHNHPAGHCVESRADVNLTQMLKSALALIDVRVLDHMIVTANEVMSMAEKGLM